MKALTLWQPYASMVALGVKTIETRSWPAPKGLVGERIAIHAAAKMPPVEDVLPLLINGLGMSPAAAILCWSRVPEHRPLPLGAVVATARVAECVPMIHVMRAVVDEETPWPNVQLNGTTSAVFCDEDNAVDVSDQIPFGDFAPGRWAWLLDEVDVCEPVPAKGAQRVWNWEDAA